MVTLRVRESEVVVHLNPVERVMTLFNRDIRIPFASVVSVVVEVKPIPRLTEDLRTDMWTRNDGGPSKLGTVQRWRFANGEGKCFVGVWWNRPAVVINAAGMEVRRVIISVRKPVEKAEAILRAVSEAKGKSR